MDTSWIEDWEIKLTADDGTDLSKYIKDIGDNGDSITIFAANIENYSKGKLQIIWKIPVLGADGKPTGQTRDSDPDEYKGVSFQRQ